MLLGRGQHQKGTLWVQSVGAAEMADPTSLYRAVVPLHLHPFVCLILAFLILRLILFVGQFRCFNKRYRREAHQIKDRTGPPYESAAFPDPYHSNFDPARREGSTFQQSDGGRCQRARM